MKKAYLIALFLLAGCATHSEFSKTIAFFKASPTKQYSVFSPDEKTPRFDPSGLFILDGKILTVSDRAEYNDIYELQKTNEQAFIAKVFLKIKLPREPHPRQRHDFEGLTFCGGKFFVTDEEFSDLLEIDPKGDTQIHHPDLKSIHKKTETALAFGTKNGGLEGIACDTQKFSLFLANERFFRMIYVLDPRTFSANDFFDVPSGWNLPRHVGDFRMYRDFADLYFEAPYLYALQRNDRRILKIDPRTKNLVAVLDLQFDEHDLYESSEPFGMAEGLALTKTQILVVLDNNGMKRKSNPADISSTLLEFSRPSAF